VHVRIKPRDDLDDVESFLLPVSSKPLEFLRPVQPVAESHPPGVAQPEERCSVRVLKVTPVGGHLKRTVRIKRVLAFIRLYFHFAGDGVKSPV
jgi:hypothetical protein